MRLSNIEIRHATPADISGIVEVMNARSMDLIGFPSLGVRDLKVMWQSLDFEESVWVAVDDQRIVGYMWLAEQPPYNHPRIWDDIHPDYRNRGIKKKLLAIAETAARKSLGKANADAQIELMNRVNQKNRYECETLEASGFKVVRRFLELLIEIDEPPVISSLADGITIEIADPARELKQIYEKQCEILEDHWGLTLPPYEGWKHAMTGNADSYDPALWFVAKHKGEIIGMALCYPRPNLIPDNAYVPDAGWIHFMGVAREWRRKGIATALMYTAFKAFYDRGLRMASLGVDANNPSGAVTLYKKAGMRTITTLEMYCKVIRPGEPDPQWWDEFPSE